MANDPEDENDVSKSAINEDVTEDQGDQNPEMEQKKRGRKKKIKKNEGR